MTATLVPITFPALGTTASVIVDGDPGATRRALPAAQAELAAIDAACSRFRPDSELCRVNAAGGASVPASDLFLEAVHVALRAARLTDGLVDPTMGRALRELGYDRDFEAVREAGILVDLPPRWPHPAGSNRPAVVTVLAHRAPGWRAVIVDRQRGTVAVPAGVELDLGATAKALAADRAARAAQQASGRGVLVSLGGDVAVAGTAPGDGWSIRVADDHGAPPQAFGQTVTVTSGGLATSGTTVRRWRHAGTEVHHLLDPTTGRPVAIKWRTVSVVAATCVDANTASTAAVILGPAAPGWLAARGLPARLVAADGTVTTVAGWPAAGQPEAGWPEPDQSEAGWPDSNQAKAGWPAGGWPEAGWLDSDQGEGRWAGS
jgi:thiamine biosynthesis lipoprotein